MEEFKDESKELEIEDLSEDEETGGLKEWFQDNLRILVSVIIVVVIAGGIYSYSKRAEAPGVKEEASSENILEKIAGTEDNKPEEPAVIEEGKTETQKEAQKKPETAQKETVKTQDRVSSLATSQETEKSFVETAGRGDSQTKLARRALANYLEKNPDSSLTAEHKIYIEDYLRKRVPQKGKVLVGSSVEFEKSLIQDAITKSKNLNERQLQNLHKYAVRVPSLS